MFFISLFISEKGWILPYTKVCFNNLCVVLILLLLKFFSDQNDAGFDILKFTIFVSGGVVEEEHLYEFSDISNI